MKAVLIWFLAMLSPAFAIIEGAETPPASSLSKAVVYLFSVGGEVCSATLVRQDVLLTAAHCIIKGKKHYAVFNKGRMRIEARKYALHPNYQPFKRGTKDFTLDLALVKLSKPAPLTYQPIAMVGGARVGNTLTLAGWGKTDYKTKAALNALRQVDVLVAAAITPHHLILRMDNKTLRGGCGGDSGGPALYNGAIVGVMIMSSGHEQVGCGGLTMVVKLDNQEVWIDEILKRF